MRKMIFLVILVVLCCTTGNAQSGKISKSEKLNQKGIQTADNNPVLLQHADQAKKVYTESAFMKDYLLTSEVPLDLPKRNDFSNSNEFRIALKQWIIENPKLIKPNKRIKSNK